MKLSNELNKTTALYIDIKELVQALEKHFHSGEPVAHSCFDSLINVDQNKLIPMMCSQLANILVTGMTDCISLTEKVIFFNMLDAIIEKQPAFDPSKYKLVKTLEFGDSLFRSRYFNGINIDYDPMNNHFVLLAEKYYLLKYPEIDKQNRNIVVLGYYKKIQNILIRFKTEGLPKMHKIRIDGFLLNYIISVAPYAIKNAFKNSGLCLDCSRKILCELKNINSNDIPF